MSYQQIGEYFYCSTFLFVVLVGIICFRFYKKKKVGPFYYIILLLIGYHLLTYYILYKDPYYVVGYLKKYKPPSGRASGFVVVEYVIGGNTYSTSLSPRECKRRGLKIGDKVYVCSNKVLPTFGIVDLDKSDEEFNYSEKWLVW